MRMIERFHPIIIKKLALQVYSSMPLYELGLNLLTVSVLNSALAPVIVFNRPIGSLKCF